MDRAGTSTKVKTLWYLNQGMRLGILRELAEAYPSTVSFSPTDGDWYKWATYIAATGEAEALSSSMDGVVNVSISPTGIETLIYLLKEKE